MGTTRRALAVLPAATAALFGLVGSQVLRAAHRTDLPSFPNQDPGGTFGDPSLPPLRIVAMGDSSITAPGVEDLDNVWVRRIAAGLSDRYCVELVSLAIGGSKARDVVEHQLAPAIRLAPDLVLLSVGANDAIRSPSTDRYRDDLRLIVNLLEPVVGAIVVVGVGDLGSIPRLPATLRPILSRRSRTYDAIATAVAAQSAKAVKVWTRGRMSTAFWEDPTLFSGDLFHAGDRGHAIFAEESLSAVRAALRIAGH